MVVGYLNLLNFKKFPIRLLISNNLFYLFILFLSTIILILKYKHDIEKTPLNL